MENHFNLPISQVEGHLSYRGLSRRQLVELKKMERENDVKSNIDSLYNSIFAVDPITLLPRGDIAVFMSDKTSPEIREFIRQNLMSPVPDADVSAKFGTLSDDDIALFGRGSNESLSSYRSRLMDFVRDNYKNSEEPGK